MNNSASTNTGILSVVGTGPGAVDLITPRARQSIEQADIVVGYKTYLDLITDCLKPEQGYSPQP
jgi:precorrin-3B methylase